MNDLPDVAGSLFTNQYKAVKIEGKKLKPNALEGTGSVSFASHNLTTTCLQVFSQTLC